MCVCVYTSCRSLYMCTFHSYMSCHAIPAISPKFAPKKKKKNRYHSIHGPAAYDILSSFEFRWWRQVGLKTMHQRTRRLVDIRRLADMWIPQEDDTAHTTAPTIKPPARGPLGATLGWSSTAINTAPTRARTFLVRGLSASLASFTPREPAPACTPTATQSFADDAWTVQLFRSIDNHASAGMPRKNADALQVGLSTLKGRVYDCSLQEAYVWAIRSAQHYIYIENQYFIGSSQAWDMVCVLHVVVCSTFAARLLHTSPMHTCTGLCLCTPPRW